MNIKNFGMTLLLVGSFLFQAKAQKKQQTTIERPALVVCVVIDQMRYDFLTRYWDQYGEGGFKRLANDGFSFNRTYFNYSCTKTGPGHASIATGTPPSMHGLVGNNWYDRQFKQKIYVVEDPEVVGLGAANDANKRSPKNMISTTLADQIRLASNFRSKSIGISLKDRGAILTAGHSANAAYWFDGGSGNWVTSTWYMNQLPNWVEKFNSNKKRLDSLKSLTWNKLLTKEGAYKPSTSDNQPWENGLLKNSDPVFPYRLGDIAKEGYSIIPETPWGNWLTTQFALEALKAENLGREGTTDFLSVSYSSTDIVGHEFGPYAIETQDTYLRMDKEIESLLNGLDKQVGKGQYLLFLTADHGIMDNPMFLRSRKMPGGIFNIKTELDALQSALKATFGTDSILFTSENLQLYLNHELLAKKRINRSEVFETARQVLMKSPSVLEVFDYATPEKSNLRLLLPYYQNGYFTKRSGDIQIVLKPGFFDAKSEMGTTHGSPYTYDTHIPLLFFGWKVPKGNSTVEASITDIAPTISAMLQIQEPNASTGKVLEFKQ